MDFRGYRVLCVGDVMLDRFVHGDVERISPEAPVPVLRLRETREMPGGAGNVAANVAALGASIKLVGLVGHDAAGCRLADLLSTLGVDSSLIASGERPTVSKTRFVAGLQQIVRADEESAVAQTPSEAASILSAVRASVSRCHAVVLSDYGKGTLSQMVVRGIIDLAAAAGIPVFVDPKSSDYEAYRGATCITPNLKEFNAAAGRRCQSEAEIAESAARIIAATGCGSILVTRSEKGMTLVGAGGVPTTVAARAREVFDVSGAGDTVIATLALAVACGRNLVQAMHIANAAAGVVVSKSGTATATVSEIMHELASGERDAPSALRTLSETAATVSHWRARGLKVGFTNGCFDILHPGHVAMLAAARRSCDRLVVALNDDRSIARLKGPARPVNALSRRADVMAAIRHVDCVTSFAEDTPLPLIEALRPDVLIKGGDYRPDDVVGADLVLGYGGRVLISELLDGHSTTRIIDRASALAEAG